MEMSCHPIGDRLLLCCQRYRIHHLSSSLQFNVRNGLHVEHSPIKRPISSSYNFCTARKQVEKPWASCLQDEFTWHRLDYNFHQRKKLSRQTVVRSELVGRGTPDYIHPLTETTLVSKVRGLCFYAVTSVAAIFLIVVMLVQHPFVLLLDRNRRKAHYFIATLWATITVYPFVKIEYEGLENLPSSDTPAVYVSNHQSFLDIYTLLTLGRSFKFISKTGIFLYPIIGWAMSMLGAIPLKRMDSRSQLECFKQCMEQLKKGASVCFFPEGTRSKDGKLGTFKKGAFSIATKTGVPVVPITLIGTGNIMPTGKEGNVSSGSVRVVIHKPVGGSDPEVLCNEVRNIIADRLHQQS
ncbi:1-acyl-sn-glycerol-3-phosphate acyltransferase BAT2 chloroplastic [Euphorbia peplus]|nr:1-acyl-sn-glycerol-3-phosphate acyltransferase BAT2 chloroplastic [Euphorbia peplus]